MRPSSPRQSAWSTPPSSCDAAHHSKRACSDGTGAEEGNATAAPLRKGKSLFKNAGALFQETGTLAGEKGHSILEATVALALFLTVLVPAVGGAMQIIAQGSVRADVQALAEAQRVMERALKERRFRDRTWRGEAERWAYQRTTGRQGQRVKIRVRVWRTRRDFRPGEVPDREPLARLVTTRLLAQNEQDGSGFSTSGF